MGVSKTLAQGGLSELKRRLLVVLVGIMVYRIGAHIPVPGVNPARLALLFQHSAGGVLGLFNMFSGGALSRFTVFALGVMPYISASIVMQLFSSLSPKLEQLKKEGEAGRRKINQYTRYGTLFLAALQAMAISKWLVDQNAVLFGGLGFYFTSTITLVTGTMFLMWIGEQMTERGIGNGISLIIFAGIVSRFPAAIVQVMTQARQGQLSAIALILLIALIAVVTYFVVFMERGQRRIAVHYARRQQGRRVFAAQSSHLPLKINMSGVIPPIFASSIILFPATIANWLGRGGNMQWLNNIAIALEPSQPLHMILYAIGIFFFCFFYTALVFNPKDTADNLKRSGAFIPGIRPGEQTANYIDSVMTRLTLVGASYLTIVALLPEFLIMYWHVPFYFGGTSLLIAVVVIMDFMAQVQAHLMSHQYESIMKKAQLKSGKARSFR